MTEKGVGMTEKGVGMMEEELEWRMGSWSNGEVVRVMKRKLEWWRDVVIK